MMARILRQLARFENSWAGDVLGLVGLWAFGLSVYFLGYGLGL